MRAVRVGNPSRNEAKVLPPAPVPLLVTEESKANSLGYCDLLDAEQPEDDPPPP